MDVHGGLVTADIPVVRGVGHDFALFVVNLRLRVQMSLQICPAFNVTILFLAKPKCLKTKQRHVFPL